MSVVEDRKNGTSSGRQPQFPISRTLEYRISGNGTNDHDKPFIHPRSGEGGNLYFLPSLGDPDGYAGGGKWVREAVGSEQFLTSGVVVDYFHRS